MASTILIAQMIAGILSAAATGESVWFIVGAYVISLAYLGILCRSHHLAIRGLVRIDNRAVWGTLYLLVWLMLLPFATAWLVATCGPGVPVVLYGLVLTMSMIADEALWNWTEGSLPVPAGYASHRPMRARTGALLCGTLAFAVLVGLVSRVATLSVCGVIAIVQVVRASSHALAG
jgi:uncharacterized membrane protein